MKRNDDGWGLLVSIGIIIALVVVIAALFYYSWNSSCGKDPLPTCNCKQDTIPAECVCSCMKPVKDCSCDQRIQNIKERIDFDDKFVTERKQELDAGQRPQWVPAGEEGAQPASPSSPKTVKAGGVGKSGVPVVSPDIAKNSCKDVVEGLCLHEQTHIDHNDQYGQCSGPINWLSSRLSSSKANAIQDESEFLAYSLEENFLIGRLKELEQGCYFKWKCRCNGVIYNNSVECAGSCPHSSLACIAPTCIQVKYDEEKGDWVWTRNALPG
jgi:hypothetical protein